MALLRDLQEHVVLLYRNCPLSLTDLQQALQSSDVHEDLVFPGAVVDPDEGAALRLFSTAVRLVTERASHGDWVLRSSWLSHLGRSHKYAPGLLRQTHEHRLTFLTYPLVLTRLALKST